MKNLWIAGYALHSAVPAAVIVAAVRIAPAVSLVVLLVIRVQVIQRESVMAGDKIDGGILSPDLRIVDIRRPDQALGRILAAP